MVLKGGVPVGVYTSVSELGKSKLIKRGLQTLYRRISDDGGVEIGGFMVFRMWVNV